MVGPTTFSNTITNIGEINMQCQEDVPASHRMTEWVRLEGTTMSPTSLLKKRHPRAHCRELQADGSWVSPMRETHNISGQLPRPAGWALLNRAHWFL